MQPNDTEQTLGYVLLNECVVECFVKVHSEMMSIEGMCG